MRFSDHIFAIIASAVSRAPDCLVRVIMEYVTMEGTEFIAQGLRELRGFDLTGSSFRGCVFEGGSLRGALLVRADLTGAIFNEVNLTGVNLYASTLDRARFIKCELTGANMQLVSRDGATMEDTTTSYVAFSERDGILVVNGRASGAVKFADHTDKRARA